jgi:hypothetical protein
VDNLLAVAERDLQDCRVRGLSDDWRFNIAYNAALQLARAALHTAGYDVPKGESHHYRAVDSLQFTIRVDATLVDELQLFRKKRSAGVYEVAGMITPTDADGMVRIATQLRTQVQDFIDAERAR